MTTARVVGMASLLLGLAQAVPPHYPPAAGWESASPESQGMSSAGLNAAVAWMDSLASPDALLVVRGGYLVSETYWGHTTADSLHDLASGTKSVGSMALAHAVEAGHFQLETELHTYFPSLLSRDRVIGAVPLQLKHLVSMAGGANVTYWSPGNGLTREWTAGLRQGPPGEVASCTEHGLARPPGSSFVYSFANPAIAEGLLRATTNSSAAEYLETHLFPQLGITQWRWLGDREGNSQPDGGSFHTAQNYAKLAYLMLTEGRWNVRGTEVQLLNRAWVEAVKNPTPTDYGPCPIYSHFFWRKDLNFGNMGRKVPSDTFYAYGGGGQFAVVVPSLDLVVVTLYGGRPVVFEPPPDIAQYRDTRYFPRASDDHLIMGGLCDGGFNSWGCWNFTWATDSQNGRTKAGKINPGMPSCLCTAQDTAPNDLLAGIMQRVVASIQNTTAVNMPHN